MCCPFSPWLPGSSATFVISGAVCAVFLPSLGFLCVLLGVMSLWGHSVAQCSGAPQEVLSVCLSWNMGLGGPLPDSPAAGGPCGGKEVFHGQMGRAQQHVQRPRGLSEPEVFRGPCDRVEAMRSARLGSDHGGFEPWVPQETMLRAGVGLGVPVTGHPAGTRTCHPSLECPRAKSAAGRVVGRGCKSWLREAPT